MARTPIGDKPMKNRLTISLLPHQKRKLKEFTRRSNMSAAWIGREGIDLMIEVIDAKSLPQGPKGTAIYLLQQKLENIRASTRRAVRKGSKS
jgi:hypothetical protein